MIDEIFEMIMKEARTRKGQTLEIHIMMVLFDVISKVCRATKHLHIDNLEIAEIKFRRKEP